MLEEMVPKSAECFTYFLRIWENVLERGGPSKKHMKFNEVDFQSRFFFTASWATWQQHNASYRHEERCVTRVNTIYVVVSTDDLTKF